MTKQQERMLIVVCAGLLLGIAVVALLVLNIDTLRDMRGAA